MAFSMGPIIFGSQGWITSSRASGALTEERRREFVKLLHKMAEEARVAIRQARKDSNDDIKRRQKDGDLSEDQARREQDEVQKLTDLHVQKVEDLLKHKEAEVLEV